MHKWPIVSQPGIANLEIKLMRFGKMPCFYKAGSVTVDAEVGVGHVDDVFLWGWVVRA